MIDNFWDEYGDMIAAAMAIAFHLCLMSAVAFKIWWTFDAVL